MMAAPNGMWECPGCGDYVDNTNRVCPRCGRGRESVLTRHSAASNTASSPQNKTEMTIEPVLATAPGGSLAADFLRVLAWILWIGGILVAILTAKDAKIDRWGDTHFSFTVFLETLLEYGLYGGFTMCAVELFENVQTIANALQGFRITKKD